MTTPTDFAAWRAKALELARECERCACSNEAEWPPNQRYTAAELDAARAALAAHLAEPPMGEPAGWLVTKCRTFVDSVFVSEGSADRSIASRGKTTAIKVPLYRHPKDSA